MIRLEPVPACHTLSDLLELRAALRRQELLVGGALRDVQNELKSWQRHRRAQELAGQPVPRELVLLWDGLEERERELALDLLQISAAHAEADQDVQAALRPHKQAG
ncbi:MAG TPA: hypothetical protein VK348_05715 [Planctomycetota bacterium]|nr:hypothetical protein [Planctomycetota bacterium]